MTVATRLERVIVDLDDRFTRPMAGMASSVSLFRKQMDGANRDVDGFGRSSDKAGASIDRFSGRLGLIANAAAVLGPALIPIAAVGIPAVAGLASQLGFAAVGAGVAVSAFQGVGEALKAMNKAHLEPTAANLEAARVAMEAISPAAQGFVTQLRDMVPALKMLRDTAATGMFPGLTEGLDSMESLLPKVQRIMAAVSGELGSIGADAGASLASDRWADFFDFLATDAPSALEDMARAAGNTAHAMTELWMAFDPMNDDFSSWMVDSTASLDKWATGLSKTDGFAEFMDYIATMGPEVAETLGSLGNALLQIVEASAPIAGPVLDGIEAFSNAVAAIADSDLGTPIMAAVAAMSAYSLAARAAGAVSAKFGQAGAGSQSYFGQMATGYQSQLTAVRSLPAAYREATAAQRALVTSQRDARLTTASYVGQLQAVNTMTSRGIPQSMTALGRLSDSLSKVEMANFGVGEATRRAAAAEAERSRTLRASAAGLGKTAGMVAGLTAVTSGAADGMGMTNTASLALMGTMAGPWGAAMGAAAGAALDLSHANDDLTGSTTRARAAMKSGDIDAMRASYKDLAAQIKATRDAGNMFDPRDTMDRAEAVAGWATGKTSKAQNQLDSSAAGINASVTMSVMKQSFAANALAAKGFHLTAAGARDAGQSAAQFTAAMLGANAALSRRGSVDAYHASLLAMKDSLEANGKTLSRNTKAGLANRAALDSIASSAIAAAEKMGNADRRTKFMDNARKGFIAAAMAAGRTRAAARALADDLGLVDRIVAKPKVTEMGAGEARGRVQDLRASIRDLKSKMVHMSQKGAEAAARLIAKMRAEINRLQNKTVYLTTVYTKKHSDSGRGPAGVTSAYGNVLHYAYGDVANGHQPELAGPGPTRIWREPETMGEAYIPLANDHRRPRARAIAAETVALLGGVAQFADGGRTEWRQQQQRSDALRYAAGGRNGGGSTSVSVAAPVVSLVGSQITAVFPGFGEVVGHVVDEKIADHDDMAGMSHRAGKQ